MLWVMAGVALLVVLLGLTAPELMGDLGGASSIVLLAFAAGIPGAVVLLVLAATRAGRHDQPGAGRPQPSRAPRPLLTAEDLRRASEADPTRPDDRTRERPDDPHGG